MEFPERFSKLPEYAFPRLRALLDGIEPGAESVAMSLGEPRHPPPPFLDEVLAAHTGLYGRYPPNEGHPELREAYCDWLSRRYGASRSPDEVFPLNGTREGLFNACIALVPETRRGRRPTVLMPNPFYQVYAVAALAAGAEPVYVPALPQTGFLPDFAAVPADLLDRAAAAYVCSPANPQGAVAGLDYWRDLIALAERYDFRIFADECYGEIYRDAPPPGILEAGGDPERILAFHSLSKRSSLPGLRSGFAAGGRATVAAMRQLRSYAGAPLPGPAQFAAAACWRDEDHVTASRELYRRKYRIADRILGDLPGYTAPQGGFFLWFRVADDEAAAVTLWREAGVRVLPGSYLSRPVDPRLGGGDPGRGYLRLALVASPEEVERGLQAARPYLAQGESGA
ncbi:MAG: aminotransferase class I/II-fold pyridoxal phosphate-dependent enzyme [Alphaproteobacteria bacterium]|nr:MAG: aminotransferase class I/II-fold pyridoxal phosphate-dependent enzyme [Alphaproteobacteria bacterium]